MVQTFLFFKRHFILICVGLLYTYLAIHMIGGRQGMVQIAETRAELSALQNKIAKVKAQRVGLEHHADQLRAKHLSEDRLDEESRQHLGFSHVNDLVIILDD
ncbi:FtsB family cell division protein [Robiginitomaculum antarcticum]|uniref:FtsB family cell division protein n=1 Tax=Robiginitomaculum antarcticum TaxID=437507 RepID=UPI00039AFB92|nr:septum formation initiator family protein [Robiginitomaculum antarcticum]